MKLYYHKKYIPSYLTLFIGFLLSCFVFYGVKGLEKNFLSYKFREESENYLNLLNSELKQDMNILNAIERLFLSSQNVSREDFKAFTDFYFKGNSKIDLLFWIPSVKGDEREVYEKAAQKEGYENFKFTKIGKPIRMVKREILDHYYPIYYVEPFKGNEMAFGFDLLSNPHRRQVIFASLESGKVTGSAKFILVRETRAKDKKAVFTLNPVYKKNKNNKKILFGFIGGVFKIDHVIESFLDVLVRNDLEFHVYDATQGLNTEIYMTKDYSKQLQKYESSNFYIEESINFPGRDWKIRFIPKESLFLTDVIKWDWLMFVLLNTISILLSIYIFIRIKYTDKIEVLMLDSIESAKKLKLSAKILENTPERVMITDKDNKIISVNGAFLKKTGYLKDEIIGSNPGILKSTHHNESFYENIENIVKSKGIWSGEIWNRKKNGEIYPEWLNIMTIQNDKIKDNIDFYVSMFSEVSNQKHVRDKIQHLAYYDALTDLPNRSFFNSKAKSLIINTDAQKKEIAFVFLGLDRFKNINDALGHTYGDNLLRVVSHALKEILFKNEILSRFGGDEFIFLIPYSGLASDLKKRIIAILDIFKSSFNVNGKEIFITASMGVSIYPSDGKSIQELIKNVDIAMYFAKKSGRGYFKFYNKNMNSKFAENLDVENKMRKALKNKEFYLEYQPQVNTITKKIVSCEALIRWKSPEFGIVSPGQFISIAEDSGLIIPMTKWILETAFCQVKKLIKFNPNIYISVNISGYQIKHGNVLGMIEEVLKKENTNLKNIELELTESMLMEDISKNLKTMSELKELDLRLAIDDFGTGYSSLSYLKKFPIDKLKIDKSFIDGIPNNEEDNVIVKTIISMARNLGFQLVAEGVETKEQFEFLKEYKCNEIQGYYFSKSVSIEKIQEYLEKDIFNLLE